jgi:hypothetical protein
MTTKQGTKMPKTTIFASDTISDLIDALRERQMEDGATYADASARACGYICSALGGFIDGLTPKAKATILADLKSRIRTVNDIRATRKATKATSATI